MLEVRAPMAYATGARPEGVGSAVLEVTHMAWRFVMQPDGLLSLFSDVVDDFTWCNLMVHEAEGICVKEYNMSPSAASDKVSRGVEAGMSRWPDELRRIRSVHGQGALDKFLDESGLREAHLVWEIMER